MMTPSNESLLALLFPMLGLLVLARVMFGKNLSVFSPIRARMAMRTFTGPTLAAVLAVLSIAGLALDGRIIIGGDDLSTTSLFVTLAFLAVALVGLGGAVGLAVVALAGVLAQLYFIALEHGLAAAVTFMALSVLMLVVLGLTRGFAP